MKEMVRDYLSPLYSTYVVPDMTTDGDPCYMAYHPELEGCMSHGETPEEALNNLAEVSEIYIAMLLEKGLDVPLSCNVQLMWKIIDPITEEHEYTFVSPSITPPTFARIG